ncbi:MAG: hypothetical protein NWE87_02940, partial [Candidatus Bathyarchaeota archaeon]|nr:hypothetical protein [Candidatus Bathyarchaeota archaeon]
MFNHQLCQLISIEFRSLEQGPRKHKIKVSVSNLKKGVAQSEIDYEVRKAIAAIEAEYKER